MEAEGDQGPPYEAVAVAYPPWVEKVGAAFRSPFLSFLQGQNGTKVSFLQGQFVTTYKHLATTLYFVHEKGIILPINSRNVKHGILVKLAKQDSLRLFLVMKSISLPMSAKQISLTPWMLLLLYRLKSDPVSTQFLALSHLDMAPTLLTSWLGAGLQAAHRSTDKNDSAFPFWYTRCH